MKALVIVDIQNDFLDGGSLEVPDSRSIVTPVNDLQKHFDLVVATQDWHPPNHKSFASNHAGKKPFDRIILNGLEQVLWPDHCIQGSEGANFPDSLKTDKIAAIFRKGMDPEIDSYSGFYDNGHKISTGLTGYLREKGVTDLYFCGLAADICVYYTIKDAVNEGFTATLVEDASKPLITESFAGVRSELANLGVRIISGREMNRPIN